MNISLKKANCTDQGLHTTVVDLSFEWATGNYALSKTDFSVVLITNRIIMSLRTKSNLV